MNLNQNILFPANADRWSSVVLISGQGRKWCAHIEVPLVAYNALHFLGKSLMKETLGERSANVRRLFLLYKHGTLAQCSFKDRPVSQMMG